MSLYCYNRKNLLISLTFFWLYVLILIGCASTGSIEEIEVNKNIKILKGEYKTIAVVFVYNGDDKSNSSVPDQLIGSIVDNLREKKIFKKVYSKSATLKKNFDLIVEVTPLDVTNADIAQSLIMTWAGISGIKTRVEIIDGKTGEKLGSSVITGKAAFKATVFTSSSMAQAIERAGEAIADYVANSV